MDVSMETILLISYGKIFFNIEGFTVVSLVTVVLIFNGLNMIKNNDSKTPWF